MKRFATVAAVLLSTAYVQADLNKRDLCADGDTDDNGNYYCQEVTGIQYSGVGGTASYSSITSMANGACASTPTPYSGNIAPFDEEISFHFRGPLQLKQFAVYIPTSASKKRDEAAVAQHAHAHAHAHLHAREAAVGDMVTATIDGDVVSWINEYAGVSTSTSTTTAAAAAADEDYAVTSATSTATAAAATTAASTASTSSTSGGTYGTFSSSEAWTRQGYYDSNGTLTGLVFLNHFGGTGSGVFDYSFGNSLSYASADGTTGASSAQILEDTTLPSTAEVIIMTDQECSSTDCGYVRPGTVAYHGFDGASKLFLMEFEMPVTGETAASIYDPVDMPAIWALNADIPRTLQYGAATCSCWTSGCGEFDIFEVLAAGDLRCKSTIHGNLAGGDSDYFARPTNGTAKAAVIMTSESFYIQILDDSVTFDSGLSSTYVDGIISSLAVQTDDVSLFAIST